MEYLKCFIKLPLKGAQKNQNPKPKQKCQVRGSSGSPRTTGWWEFNWRMEMGWRQRALQPISLRRDVRAPPATCLISSAQKVVERYLPSLPKVLPTADAAPSTVSKSFQQGRTHHGNFLFSFTDKRACWRGVLPSGSAGTLQACTPTAQVLMCSQGYTSNSKVSSWL